MSKISKRISASAAAVALAAGIGLATPAAQADAAGVWDRVAKCESGGNWKINTGNGFYGGLQFTKSTWRAYGGGKYASTANKASKAQQIKIAQKVLKGQGPGAWPVCSRKAGLTRANGGASGGSATTTHRKATSTKHKKTTHKSTSGATVRVHSGDTLAKIAARHHVKGGWKGLWKLNKHTVKNPNQIRVGQVLKLR